MSSYELETQTCNLLINTQHILYLTKCKKCWGQKEKQWILSQGDWAHLAGSEKAVQGEDMKDYYVWKQRFRKRLRECGASWIDRCVWSRVPDRCREKKPTVKYGLNTLKGWSYITKSLRKASHYHKEDVIALIVFLPFLFSLPAAKEKVQVLVLIKIHTHK